MGKKWGDGFPLTIPITGMSVFRLKSDFRFFRMKETGIKLIKYNLL